MVYLKEGADEPGVAFFNARVVESKRTVVFRLQFCRYGSGHVILGNDVSLNEKIVNAARRFRQPEIWAALFAPRANALDDMIILGAIRIFAPNLAFSVAFLDWPTQQWCILVVGKLSTRYPVVVCEHGTTVAVIDRVSTAHGFVKRVLPVARFTHMFTLGLNLPHPMPLEFARSTNKELIPLLQVLRDPWDKAWTPRWKKRSFLCSAPRAGLSFRDDQRVSV